MLLLGFSSKGVCKTYKYIDKQGQTHYSDKSPQASVNVQEFKDKIATHNPLTKDLNDRLVKKFPANNPVEIATLATVEISSEVMQGSGFFLSDDGYIVTNKHVVKPVKSDQETNKKIFSESKLLFEIAKERLYNQEKLHDVLYNELVKYEKLLKRKWGRFSTKALESKYEIISYEFQVSQKQLEYLESDYYSAKKEFERAESFLLKSGRDPYRGQRYTIRIKDGTKLKADFIAASKDHDLAFLKLSGYKTPFLVSLGSNQVLRGARVHAIGSPLGISDSLTTGTVTSIQGNYIYTDASIFPGNSGGPLIDEAGKVLGVITLKKTKEGDSLSKGIGIAISAHIVNQEFNKIRSK